MRYLIAFSFAACLPTAAAAEGWQYNIVPYLWAGGTDGRLSSGRLPQDIVVNMPFRDILHDLDMGGMLALEGRKAASASCWTEPM